MPNAPQKYARQQSSQQSSAQYSVSSSQHQHHHFPPHIAQSHTRPQQQLQQQQRRHLASPFPGPHHGPTTPGTPTAISSASPSSRMLQTSSNLGRDDNALKVYYMSPPADLLPLLKDGPDAGYPDFFPWNGHHAEDQMTESYIQHGFEDKPYLSNETGSARQTLYAAVRQRSTLKSLSSFMMSAIEKRQELNKITSPTTFKPPPRVTLTDHKRDAWLRDLATPTVPLRRLSRTIPHGIRNRVLVEQCCHKSVPIHRAVWFARCVGANELRGLKRKGNNASIADAEAQWVREWTVQLAGFIEKTLAECGQPSSADQQTTKQQPQQQSQQQQQQQPATPAAAQNRNWRSKVEYVLHFASHLYSEDLIDRSYFLDWMIALLEKSTMQRTLLSLLVIRIFWQKLLGFPAKCKKLAQVLLARFKLISIEAETNKTPHAGLYQVLQFKVASFIWDLSSCSDEAFVMPENWHSQRPVLQKAIHLADVEPVVADKAFESIALANMSAFRQQTMAEYSGVASRNSEEEQRERLLGVLNEAGIPYDVDQIAEDLILAASMPPSCYDDNDPRQLVDVLCRWAICNTSSETQPQTERVELASSVLKKWASTGKPVFEALFSFFDLLIELKDVSNEMAIMLLQQLVKKAVLVPDMYMRKVIARGIFLLPKMKEKARCHAFVLRYLPFEECALAVQNQRDVLLRNCPPPDSIGGVSTQQEEETRETQAGKQSHSPLQNTTDSSARDEA
ncbi:hypothetical protein BZA70DRAFT_267759 [Myxozyma melibiosi]|uniref:Mediator of RNA polymerase II transcription subunit 12 n=1 Tax=Myxozyma melibiosi TaxID=54550 RepID=A0ABR1F5X9_9ASCO